MEDVSCGLKSPTIMDVKMGLRSYREEDVAEGVPRLDLLQKMEKVSSTKHAQNQFCDKNKNATITANSSILEV